MKEMVTPAQAEVIVRGAVLGLVVIGVLVAIAARRGPRMRRAAPALGAIIAGAGLLVYAGWAVYNTVTAKYGLDSVKAALINLAIFVIVGVVYGVAAATLWRRATAPTNDRT